MKQNFLLTLFLALLASTSCNKPGIYDHHPTSYVITGDYFIVGHDGAYTVAGYRPTYYLVNNGQLRNTQIVQGAAPDDINKFNFNYIMSNTDYQQVADLPYSIPPELKTQNGASIGSMMPDVGYYDVRASMNGIAYRWRIEGNVDSTSQAVQAFALRLRNDFH